MDRAQRRDQDGDQHADEAEGIATAGGALRAQAAEAQDKEDAGGEINER